MMMLYLVVNDKNIVYDDLCQQIRGILCLKILSGNNGLRGCSRQNSRNEASATENWRKSWKHSESTRQSATLRTRSAGAGSRRSFSSNVSKLLAVSRCGYRNSANSLFGKRPASR